MFITSRRVNLRLCCFGPRKVQKRARVLDASIGLPLIDLQPFAIQECSSSMDNGIFWVRAEWRQLVALASDCSVLLRYRASGRACKAPDV